MGIFDSMNISARGMTAQRVRMDIVSQNLANINTTRTEDGGPYTRQTVVFEEVKEGNSFGNVFNETMNKYNTGNGVKVAEIVEDDSAYLSVYDPTHPDADEDGNVLMPNVNSLEEMTNLISANRSYEANVTAFNATKSIVSRALEIGK